MLDEASERVIRHSLRSPAAQKAAIPGVEALGANLRAALTGGAVRGADRLLDGLGDVTAGRMDPREYLLDAGRGAWEGAITAGAAEELSELGRELLLRGNAGSDAAGLLPGKAGGHGKLRDILGLLGTGQNDLTKNAADAAAAAAGYLDRAAAVGDEAAYRTALSVLRGSARELRTLAPALPSARAAAAAELADRAIRTLPEHAASLPDGLTVRNGLVERTEEAEDRIANRPAEEYTDKNGKSITDGGHTDSIRYHYYGTLDHVIDVAASFPDTFQSLLTNGWTDISNEMESKHGYHTLEEKNTGLRIRFDEGHIGAPGFEGKNHYHVFNPNATGKNDLFLDAKGNPVNKKGKHSHILPKGGMKHDGP